MKRFLLFTLALVVLFTVPVFAAYTDTVVWAYEPEYAMYESDVLDTIVKHVPLSTLRAFNDHGGNVVISTTGCDPRGKAGMTNGDPILNGWYAWPSCNVYVELTPSYGLPLMKQTVLHEFGHVFDMQTEATKSDVAIAMITSELPAYNNLEVATGYMIPSMKDSHELFAQVFAAVVSGNDGTVRHSAEIIATCPQTANYVKDLISKNP